MNTAMNRHESSNLWSSQSLEIAYEILNFQQQAVVDSRFTLIQDSTSPSNILK